MYRYPYPNSGPVAIPMFKITILFDGRYWYQCFFSVVYQEIFITHQEMTFSLTLLKQIEGARAPESKAKMASGSQRGQYRPIPMFSQCISVSLGNIVFSLASTVV